MNDNSQSNPIQVDVESFPRPEKIPVRFDETWFAYDSVPVVRDINFSIMPGEFAAILGPNGSGKTTLMKLALGLLKPSSGRVLLFGEPSDNFTDWHRIGYVPENSNDRVSLSGIC